MDTYNLRIRVIQQIQQRPPGFTLQAISKMQITFKDKARADEKAQHTWECEHFEEARNTVIGR
jgi:hypothetical protein